MTLKAHEQAIITTITNLGLLIRQAALYGLHHNVTAGSFTAAITSLTHLFDLLPTLELSLSENDLLINGYTSPAINNAGRNLLERLTLYSINGLVISPPFNMPDLIHLTQLLTTPPQDADRVGGFKAMLEDSPLKGVRCQELAYTRTTANDTETDTSSQPTPFNHSLQPLSGCNNTWDLDLDPDADIFNHSLQPLSGCHDLLQHLAATLNHKLKRPLPTPDTGYTLNHLASLINYAESTIRQRIDTIGTAIADTNQMILQRRGTSAERLAILERNWRELLAEIAELHQEIAQPLTVTSGVLQMICEGQVGNLTPEQSELLNLAYDSANRANQLVAHLHTVVGLPDSFTPNAATVAKSYS